MADDMGLCLPLHQPNTRSKDVLWKALRLLELDRQGAKRVESYAHNLFAGIRERCANAAAIPAVPVSQDWPPTLATPTSDSVGHLSPISPLSRFDSFSTSEMFDPASSIASALSGGSSLEPHIARVSSLSTTRAASDSTVVSALPAIELTARVIPATGLPLARASTMSPACQPLDMSPSSVSVWAGKRRRSDATDVATVASFSR